VWRTLESMVTAVAMDSRVQKLLRVRGGSYTGVSRRSATSCSNVGKHKTLL